MATEAQILANRANAKRSTGPRTEAGKQASRLNALKTGIHAQSHVIRNEDPEALAQLAAEYNAEFRPTTPRQRDLVDTMVHNEWHIRRLRTVEIALWEHKFEEHDIYEYDNRKWDQLTRRHPLRRTYNGLDERLDRLQRSIHAYERSSQRALKQLQDLQALETEPSPSEIGFVPSNPLEDEVPRPACPVPAPPPQSPIGFVPSKPAGRSDVPSPDTIEAFPRKQQS